MVERTVFQRYEKKYLITAEQCAALRDRFGGRLEMDRYGEYSIFNLYYDTGDYDVARSSLGKPVYKEKFRLRSYGMAGPAAPVFLELKKKYRGVVYKRRARLSGGAAAAFLAGGSCGTEGAAGTEAQVLAEVRRFMDRHPGLAPRVFLAYDRIAYAGQDDGELRLTMDTNIRFRETALRLDREGWGHPLLDPGTVLLELKTPGAIPPWLCRALSHSGIFPRSFSKYGFCYGRFLRRSSGPGGDTLDETAGDTGESVAGGAVDGLIDDGFINDGLICATEGISA